VAEAAGAGAAVLLSSHEPDSAVPMADRVVGMAGGQVVSDVAGGRRAGVPLALAALGVVDPAEERAGVA
jgi:ABC-type uncharacterized transport system ATPase subunit